MIKILLNYLLINTLIFGYKNQSHYYSDSMGILYFQNEFNQHLNNLMNNDSTIKYLLLYDDISIKKTMKLNESINLALYVAADWYDINGKIKWKNKMGDYFENGKKYKSLGKNILVGYHNRDSSGYEEINSAMYELYLENYKEGPLAILSEGNTIPVDIKKYGTLKEGLYPAQFKPRSSYSDEEAIIINYGNDVPTVFGNPNNIKNRAKPINEQIMDNIFFHRGNLFRESLTTLSGKLISIGCQIGPNGNGSFELFNKFMRNIPKNFIGNYYLRGPKN